jgi:AraC family transcriptional regulator
MMTPRFEILQEKKLLGYSMKMCFAEHAPQKLWQAFMPRKKEIKNMVGNNLYSLEVYPEVDFFKNYNPKALFEKWAATEVSNYENVPEGMKPFLLHEGLYAVFTYKGKSSDAKNAYEYILLSWLPKSEYELAHLPHFAVMGEKYKNNDPESEEEIWIPVKKR